MHVQGTAEHGFGPVAEAFAANFAAGEEIGAAICIYHRDRKVVDLWGGTQDPAANRPWREDTVVPMLSTGKGLMAAAALLAAARGQFGLDDPVAAFWPGFARRGKEAVRVRHILDHSSGLILFGRALTRRDLVDPATVAACLEDMVPAWRPGQRRGYQLATFGTLLAEVISRTDPFRRPFHRWFEEEVAGPLGLQFEFGLSRDRLDRLAIVHVPPTPHILGALRHAPAGVIWQALNPFSRLHRTFREAPDLNLTDPDWLALEFPSANGTGEVRAVARLYASLVAPSEVSLLGAALREALLAPATVPAGGPRDAVLGAETAWHLGFVRPSPEFRFSPSPRAFGMPGLGGSFGFCDPDAQIGYAYAPNRLGPLPFKDPREQRLRQALYAALRTLAPRPDALQPRRDTAGAYASTVGA